MPIVGTDRNAAAFASALFAGCLLFAMAVRVTRPDGPPVPAMEVKLFDGQTLDGWTIENDCEAAVENGLLVLKEGNGWLRSHHTFADFLLHVEWRAEKSSDYDAGIYVRTRRGGKPFPQTGYQVNLLDGKEGNVSSLEGAASSGLIRRGEWNTFDLRVVNDTVALEINGQKAWQAAGLKERVGHIGLQCEVPKGGRFQFRSIVVTEIGYRSLFNGRDLDGWEGAGSPASDCWQVKEGLLQCTGAPGPWLRSRDEFADFNLRFDYVVSAGGNSGVYVRVPEDGNHHRENDQAPPAGFEVQILDDDAPEHRELKDFQYSASVYDISGANPRVSKSAGSWNSLEINARGQHVTVTHNGLVVVDATEEKFPLLALRQLRGRLGLQNHSTLVSFRNLRVGPPLPVVE